MLWTIVLVGTGITGTWLSAKHWWGWIIGAVNEVLWFAYALTTRDLPLSIMAVVWLLVNVRNIFASRKVLR